MGFFYISFLLILFINLLFFGDMPAATFEIAGLRGGDAMMISLIFCNFCIFFTLSRLLPHWSKHYFFWPLFLILSLFFSFYFHMRLLGFGIPVLPGMFACHKESFMTSYYCFFFCSAILLGEEACCYPWSDQLEFTHQQDIIEAYQLKISAHFKTLNLKPMFVRHGAELTFYRANQYNCLIFLDFDFYKVPIKDLNTYLNAEDDIHLAFSKSYSTIPSSTKRFIWLNPPYSNLKITSKDINIHLNNVFLFSNTKCKSIPIYIDSFISLIEIKPI